MRTTKVKPPTDFSIEGLFDPGDFLLSHALPGEVPLTLVGLTAVFGMGTGVSPPLLPPENYFSEYVFSV